MPDTSLLGLRILVVEDEYMLAHELQVALEDAGAVVLGPVGTLADTLGIVAAEERIDGALLDTNLGGEMVYPAADMLMGRHVPIIFTTGYDASATPDRFAHFPRCEKPITMPRLLLAIGRGALP